MGGGGWQGPRPGRKGLLLLILLVMEDPAIVISHRAVVMTDGSSV